MKYKSVSIIDIAVNSGEYDDTPIRDWADCFRKETGMIVRVHDLTLDEYLQTIVHDAQNGKSSFDVIAYAPLLIQQVVTKDAFLDLRPLLADELITSPDTIEGMNGDFFDAYLDYGAWYDTRAEMPGKSDHSILIALPGTHTGATMLLYRQDVLEHDNVEIPTTWEQFNLLVKEVSRPKEGFYGTTICGKGGRFLSFS